MKSKFVGRWRITEMEQWDQDYIDMEEAGQITFRKEGLGSFHFGCVDASLDWRYDETLDRVDFSFEGADEDTPVSGRGWAGIDGNHMEGQIVFHLGDESGFHAEKA